MSRYEITHRTRYDYAEQVGQSLNLAFMMPRDTQRQTCLSRDISVTPAAATANEREDYFGNHAFEFTIEHAHRQMEVVARSTVDLRPSESSLYLDFGDSCSQVLGQLKDLTDPETLAAREFVLDSPLTQVGDDLQRELKAYAAPLFRDDTAFLTAVRQLTQKIFTDFTYDPYFSEVTTALKEVFEHRKGVCQDFAHLAIACLRSLGFAARYVSGYLETLPAPGRERLVGADASHAWFSVYATGTWFEFDPTNDKPAGQQHIVTAWGRDYSDVPPLRGVVYGGGEQHDLKVSVDVRRLD